MKNIKIFPLVILMILPINAFAYLDPGTGSIIIQSLIASVAAAGYVIRIYWHKIVSFFSRKKDVSADKE